MFLTTEVCLYWCTGKLLGFYTKLIVGPVNRKEILKNERRLLPEVPVSSLEYLSRQTDFNRNRRSLDFDSVASYYAG